MTTMFDLFPTRLCFFLVCVFMSAAAQGKTVKYELTIANQPFNVTGRDVDFALMVNGGIPAPTLEFTDGDDAEITVVNNVANGEVSLHWHGILLPPEEDGVAYVNTPPIFPGKSRVFKFKIRQHGTYWYHSHTMLQEQKGVYGAIVIHPKKESLKTDKEAVVVLSDWSDENADQIIRNLRKDGDYYLYKKHSVRSLFEAVRAGGLGTYIRNEWNRMGGMDVSDVGYDAFLINGKRDSQLVVAHPGERLRLRIINAASSSYFYVSIGGARMEVISADGQDITPVRSKELQLGMAETYDVLFTVPEHKNFELRATAQDVTGFGSAWIGMGEKVHAPDKLKPDLYAPMDHSAMGGHQSMDHASMNHSTMDHSMAGMHHAAPPADADARPVLDALTIDDLKSPTATVFPKEAKRYEIKLVLGGDMNRYVWHINGKTIHDDRLLMINHGDVVTYTFENRTMMHHPMHLHGHFFRVLNKNGDRSPLKHTVDVPPMASRTIEFYADEPGQWMLHCHNLYHMETGMARVVKYSTFAPSSEMQHLDHHRHDAWYGKGSLQAASNLLEARYRLSQTWNEFEVRAESRRDEDWKAEGDFFYRRWSGNYLSFVGGGSTVHHETRAEIGVGYLLPMLIRSNFLVDHKGKLRVDLEKRFQWTSAIFTDVEYRWRQDSELGSEVTVSLMYGPGWDWSGGLKLTDHSLGAGLQFQF